MTSKNEIWDQIKENIRGDISNSEFNTWVSQASLVEISPKLAIIAVPNKFVASWLSDNCSQNIEKVLLSILGEHPKVRFSYQTHSTSSQEKKKTAISQKEAPPFFSGLDPSRTFSGFVASGSNGLACSSAMEVASNPFYKYNPLYIFSKWSLGKTHLLHAIGNEAVRKLPDSKAVYLSAEDVLSRIQKAASDTNTHFWETEEPPHFLLLDDFHTLVSHRELQRELLSLCTQFLERKRQLVVAASAPPSQLENLLPQLRSRLEWGLITEIAIPDQRTKMKVIHQKARQEGIEIQEDAAFFLASSTNNLKDLVAQIEKIKIHAPLYGNRISITTVQSILENELHTRIGPALIQEITAKYFQISPSDLKSSKKERRISYPRQIAMFLTRKYTDLSLKEIGKAFGNKHHSSVIYSISSIEDNIKSKIGVVEDITRLKGFLINGVGT